MFGFRQFFGKEDKGKSSRQNQMQVGVQLLGSLLVCYREIASVTYDPKRDNLELAFMVRQPLPPGKGADEFADFLQESLEAYHDLEAGYNAWSSVEAEEQGDTLLFHVARNLMDLSRGELEVMAELMLDRFGDNLMVDSHTEDLLSRSGGEKGLSGGGAGKPQCSSRGRPGFRGTLWVASRVPSALSTSNS